MSGVGNGVSDEENAFVLGEADGSGLGLRTSYARPEKENGKEWFHVDYRNKSGCWASPIRISCFPANTGMARLPW